MIAIKLMTMGSEPGYVLSRGWTDARLVSADDAADCAGDEESLQSLEGPYITKDDLQDVKLSTQVQGVCHYQYTTGTFEVPVGMAVVQCEMIDVCTNNQVYSRAWIVNEESLSTLYQERAERYTELAQNAKEKQS